MTTSSNKTPGNTPKPSGEHWRELSAVLPELTIEQFGEWMDEQLAGLDKDLAKYITKVSLRKSLRS
jgi:hypothetical protein